MAEGSSIPPSLNLRRSAQSGSKVMTAAWQVVYTESTTSSLLAYLFGGAHVNLTPMQAGDTINVRIRKILVSGGAWVNHDQVPYTNVQPTNHPAFSIGPLFNIYGVEISMQQTAGVLRTIETEFYDAKRLGLA